MASEISHNYPLMEVMGYVKMDDKRMILQKENERLMFEAYNSPDRDYVGISDADNVFISN